MANGGIFSFKALPTVPPGVKFEGNEFQMFIAKLIGTVRFIFTNNYNLTPASCPANSTVNLVVATPGMFSEEMHVIVNPPSLPVGLGIAYSRVTAVDQITITFINVTAGALTPTAGVYKVTAIKN